MALDEEQRRRATLCGVFTSTCVLSALMEAVCLGVHAVSLYGIRFDTLAPGLRFWHLFVPLVFAAPPLAYYYHLRSGTWTAAHRSWPGWARAAVVGSAVYAAITIVAALILMGGGVPMEADGVTWLGYPGLVFRLLSQREYDACVALMWQTLSAVGLSLYLLLMLYAWQFRRDSSDRFREIRLWRGRD